MLIMKYDEGLHRVMLAHAHHAMTSTTLCRNFMRFHIIPYIQNYDQSKSTDQERVILECLWRVTAWINALHRLYNPSMTAAACACCRGLLEMKWELQYLIKKPKSVNRYLNYSDAARYQNSMLIDEACRTHPHLIKPSPQFENYKKEPHFASDKKKYDQHLRPLKVRKNWTGMSMKDLAIFLGDYENYLRTYKYLSVNTHSGPLGNFGATPQQVLHVFAFAHGTAAHNFYDICELVLTRLGEPKFSPIMKTLRTYYLNSLYFIGQSRH